MKQPVFPSSNSPDYVKHGSMDRVPENVSFLASVPSSVCQLSDIVFKWHSASQHVCIENFQPPSYYEDYIMTATYSDKMQALQKSQLERLVSLYERPQGIQSFVEIGCGDGSFMKYVREHVTRVVGIEPSSRFADEARCAGFEVLDGYVGSSVLLTNEKFDSFASRQVFEHLPDPQDVLVGIRQMLSPGAVGLIEVPNGQRALRLHRFFEFFPDHVNYYSVNSLVALASGAGFNVIACQEAFGGDYLELWLRYEPEIESSFSEMVKHRDNVCSTLAGKIDDLASEGKRIVIWGCGAKTLSILAACPANVLAIIDSDPHKHGRYVPNTSIPVIKPDEGATLLPDVVVVLALSYREEVAALIRRTIPSCQWILTLDDHGAITSLC